MQDAQVDMISVQHFDLGFQPPVVEESAVPAIEVSKKKFAFFDEQAAVAFANDHTGRSKMALVITADEKRKAHNVKYSSLPFARSKNP
jgi:hypothetical protein